ncbi:MAG: hypothetical protein J0H69_20815 [Burkholderiales bacterium]|nr:hypothetical protein [Burkholderiales bacterium]
MVPSEFFISGFREGDAASLARPSELEIRGTELRQWARTELNRFEFGLQDRTQGRDTQAARDIAGALEQAGRLSHPRARQRALSYTPREGQEHCPHCWVFLGNKHALQFTPSADGQTETGSCGACHNQYQLSKV